MIKRVEVGFKERVTDTRGDGVAKQIRNFLGINVESVKTRNIYTLDTKLSEEEVELARQELFTDPVIQYSSIDESLDDCNFDYSIAISFKPGVTDNVGGTTKQALEDMLDEKLGEEESASAAMQYLMRGINKEQAQTIANELLANKEIENAVIQGYNDWKANGVQIPSSKVVGKEIKEAKEINLDLTNEELMKISSKRTLALDLREMKAIRDYFKRPNVVEQRKTVGLRDKPTDSELEKIAQTWSEHCHHKIFNGIIQYTDEDGNKKTIDSLFRTYIKKVTDELNHPWLLSVFKDNAGVVKFNDKKAFVYKIETHNSPSALDPFGGAITGIVGVNRDPLGTGLGAELMANVWGYCLGDPFFIGKMSGGLLHPKRVRDGVHQGVIDGGNQSGIPYTRGWEIFDGRYAGKPLVFCGTLAEFPLEINGKPSHIKEAKPGDIIVMVGGRVGKDGIHGATFSSEELHSGSPVQAVQIGDPITQKKMTDMLLEARNRSLYSSITDNGAGGLSSSIGEMGLDTNGFIWYANRVPLKYQGLEPWEIIISEAQERMTIAVSPSNVEEYMKLSAKRRVESTVLGEFNESGKAHIKYGDKTVVYIDMDFLHHGDPKYNLEATFIKKNFDEPVVEIEDHTETLRDMLKRLNVCSGEEKARQYDHEVKGRSIIKPFVGKEFDVPSDASIMLAEYGSLEGVIMAEGVNPFFSDIDTYWMAASVIDEAVRKIISAGGRMDKILGGLDNFCWPNVVKDKMPERSHKLAQLVRANEALYDFCSAYAVALISGKDSMSNDCTKVDPPISIPPTLLFSLIAKMDNISKAVTMDVKNPGDLVYAVGLTKNELGASEFLRYYGDKTIGQHYVGNNVPKVNADTAKIIYNSLSQAMDKRLVRSSHTPTKGGIGIALAKTAFAGDYGLDIELDKLPSIVNTNYSALYSESNSRFIVTVNPANESVFRKMVRKISYNKIGVVRTDEQFNVRGVNGVEIIHDNIYDMKKDWKSTLEKVK